MANSPLVSQTSSPLIKIQARKQTVHSSLWSLYTKKMTAFKPDPHPRKVNSIPHIWAHPCRVWALKRPHPQGFITLTTNRTTGCPQIGLARSCPHMRLGIACRLLEDGRKCQPPWQMCQDPSSCLSLEPHSGLCSPPNSWGCEWLPLWTQRVPAG